MEDLQMQLASKFPIRGASNVGEEIEKSVRQAAMNSRLELAAAPKSNVEIAER